MNYTEWNNALAKFYFNEGKAEQEVHLFITKHDIINIGREEGEEGTEKDIFGNFINAIRFGDQLKQEIALSPVETPLELYIKWINNRITSEVPPYIAYLVAYILPLTEPGNSDYNWNNYYGRVNDFFKAYGILNGANQTKIGSNNFGLLDQLWKDLEEWSILKKNTELGYFELHPFSNGRWIHVGNPLSQCIFPIYSINNLPRLFEISGFVPGEEIDADQFRKMLVKYGKEHIWLSEGILNAIRDPANELGQSIISIVKKNYNGWSGVTDSDDKNTNAIKKGNTIAQLWLCLELNFIHQIAKPYFRLHTTLDYPEDLSFDRQYKCSPQSRGWSKPMLIPFTENSEFEDDLNKWKTKIPVKDVRLLIEGKNFHLSGWLETSYMIASSKMLLVAKQKLAPAIEEWGGCFAKGDFKKYLFSGLPQGYVLYEIKNPPIDHPDIPALQFKPDKKVALSGGVRIGVRTWLTGLLPEVELENGRGNEEVYLNYEGEEQQIGLERKEVDQPVWKLPENIELDRHFYIKSQASDIKSNQLKNKIIGHGGNLDHLDEGLLPPRDQYGQISQHRNNQTGFVLGSKVVESFYTRIIKIKQDTLYGRHFRPRSGYGEYTNSDNINISDLNEMLITFLTIKAKCSTKDYYEAFESVYHEKFTPEEIELHPIELSKLKQGSLSHLDYMGFLDYEYSTNEIVVNPPQLMLIPANSGRKALLIGGRTPDLLKKIFDATLAAGLQFNLIEQDQSLKSFILPKTCVITGFDSNNGYQIEQRIRKVAELCSLSFEPDKFSQFALAEFSGDIQDYKNQLNADERFNDQNWKARIFDAERLKFISVPESLINKSFSLVEYRLNEYTFIHKLWENRLSYNINKNWGRYIVLNNAGKQVIFNDRNKEIIAIPAAIPLPRLIAEAITLFSGKAAKREFLCICGIKTWFTVYENIPHLFADHYFKKVGQNMIETSIATS